MEYTAYKAVLTLKIHKRPDYGTASFVIRPEWNEGAGKARKLVGEFF